MSIYYNHTQKQPHKQLSRSRSPPQYISEREKVTLSPKEAFQNYAGNSGKVLRESKDFPQMQKQPQLQDWQDIGNIKHGNNSAVSPQKQSPKQGIKAVPQKSPPREEIKNKLSFIVNYLEEENSVAEVTHFHGGSDREDELDQSTSTIQSNDRRKYASLPRKQERQGRRPFLAQDGGKGRENRQLIGQKTAQNEEFALQQKPIQKSKSRPKYLFYKKVQEQRDKPQKRQAITKPIGPSQISMRQSPFRSPGRQEAIEVVPLPDYKYVKDVHPPSEKKARLKNKLGFIVDLFQKDDEAASVSYYSESHQSQKESMEIKPEKKAPPEKKEQKQPVVQNVFEHDPRQAEDYEHEEEISKPKSKVLINTSVNKSAQFEDLKIPLSPIPKIQPTPQQKHPFQKIQREFSKEIVPTESVFLKIKKSVKVNNSLERIELQMAQINRNRSKSKLSATKSVENNPKPQRYNEDAEEELQNVEMRGKKKSMDERNLSRHIQNSINRKSSSVPSNEYQEQLSKSKSAESKFSIKLVEMQLQKSSQREDKSISDHVPVSPKAASSKKSEENPFQDELTVKKAFPIARKESLPKNNPNYSKYMKINFKDSSESHDNDIAEDIPSLLIKKTQQIERPRPNDSPRRETIKISSNVNTGEDTTRFSLKPVNKIEFSIDRAKRFNTEHVQQKEDLSHQEKKFLALLKKREEALLKRVKEQVLNNNPSTIIRENLEQRSKGFSNDTFEKIVVKDESSSNKSPKNYYQAQRRDKMSLKSQQPKETEIRSYFPTLNMSPSKQPHFETFYNGSPLKRNNSKNVNYITSKKKGLSEPISSDSEMSKTLEDRMEEIKNTRRQPSKISYYNIKKLHKESSLNEKNFSSKEKYERLKQLLQKI